MERPAALPCFSTLGEPNLGTDRPHEGDILQQHAASAAARDTERAARCHQYTGSLPLYG